MSLIPSLLFVNMKLIEEDKILIGSFVFFWSLLDDSFIN